MSANTIYAVHAVGFFKWGITEVLFIDSLKLTIILESLLRKPVNEQIFFLQSRKNKTGVFNYDGRYYKAQIIKNHFSLYLHDVSYFIEFTFFGPDCNRD